MRSTVALFALIAGASSPLLGQRLEGAWKPVEVVVDSGPDRGRHTTDVQPGLLIFTKRHYSMTFVQGFKARPLPSDSATNEQLGLLFVPFCRQRGNVSAYRLDSHLISNRGKEPGSHGGEAFQRHCADQRRHVVGYSYGRVRRQYDDMVRVERR